MSSDDTAYRKQEEMERYQSMYEAARDQGFNHVQAFELAVMTAVNPTEPVFKEFHERHEMMELWEERKHNYLWKKL